MKVVKKIFGLKKKQFVLHFIKAYDANPNLKYLFNYIRTKEKKLFTNKKLVKNVLDNKIFLNKIELILNRV